MTKTKTSRKQAWRRNKIEADRSARENKQQLHTENRIDASELGPQQSGRIICHFGANFSVQDSHGNHHLCLSRRNLPKLVCGDHVTWQSTGEQEGVIVAFAMPDGEEFPGTIVAVGDKQVNVDFNHPLAGHEITFDVEILEVVNGGESPAIQ